MRSIVWRLVTTVLGLFVAAAATAAPYTNFYVFGDSLFDSGNAYAITGAYPVSPPYNRQFSNGPVASEYLAARLGFSAIASEFGGTNYAVGGATSGSQNFSATVYGTQTFPPPFSALPGRIALLSSSGLTQQITAFTAGEHPDLAISLVAIWAGANDLFLTTALVQAGMLPATAATFQNAGALAALNVENAINALILEGARHILTVDMPDLGRVPAANSPTLQSLWSTYTNAYNSNFIDAGYLASVNPSVDVTLFSVFDLLNDVLARPANFGFTNVTSACLPTAGPIPLGAPCTNPDQYVFWDGAHPTTRAHEILANLMFVAAVPSPGTLSLLAVGLAGLALRRRRLLS